MSQSPLYREQQPLRQWKMSALPPGRTMVVAAEVAEVVVVAEVAVVASPAERACLAV